MTCVTTPSTTILLNGSPFGKVNLERGLRQRDPISPYLFILCSEILSRLLFRAELDGKITGIKLSRSGPRFTHLAFVDDLLLCGRATKKEATGFLECLNTYCRWSGQKVNGDKSNVHFSDNIRGNKARDLLQVLGFKLLRGQGRYLGLPFHFSKSRAKDLEDVVQRVQLKLASWKSRCLSRAGREALAKSVGLGTPSYA